MTNKNQNLSALGPFDDGTQFQFLYNIIVEHINMVVSVLGFTEQDGKRVIRTQCGHPAQGVLSMDDWTAHDDEVPHDPGQGQLIESIQQSLPLQLRQILKDRGSRMSVLHCDFEGCDFDEANRRMLKAITDIKTGRGESLETNAPGGSA